MSEVTTNEYNEDGKLIRKIRSFVRREGRLTKGQENAMNECWPTMGIDYKAELLDWKEVFGNDNPVVLEIGFGMGASLVEMAKNAPEKTSSVLKYIAQVLVLVFLMHAKRYH